MYVSNKQLCDKVKEYGCIIDENRTRMINMGDGKFANPNEILGTMGLGPCVGLVVYSDEMSYMAHIDMGNMIGINFDSNGSSIRLQELKNRIKSSDKKSSITLATVLQKHLSMIKGGGAKEQLHLISK